MIGIVLLINFPSVKVLSRDNFEVTLLVVRDLSEDINNLKFNIGSQTMSPKESVPLQKVVSLRQVL